MGVGGRRDPLHRGLEGDGERGFRDEVGGVGADEVDAEDRTRPARGR